MNSFDDIRAKSPGEIARAKAFDKYSPERCGVCGFRKLTDYPEGVIVISTGGPPIIDAPNRFGVFPASPTEEQLQRRQACSAEMVVVGRPTNQRVWLNAEESGLFTDRTIEIDEWMRPRDRNEMTLLVSEMGGDVFVGPSRYTTGAGGNEGSVRPGQRVLPPDGSERCGDPIVRGASADSQCANGRRPGVACA